MVWSLASGEALADMLDRWANFDEDFIKVALDDVLRCKRMAKMDASRDTFSEQENSEDDDNKDYGKSKAYGQRSSSQKLLQKNFLRTPEALTLLAETLHRYSEDDLYASFNYLREENYGE
ncbi:hypothetical protein C2S53_002234 [Perilla frutescens var. hirtella]|uniref:Uncharacterized protein n=1 Tax=Perilla frutescens var. hirtella TaxID=608512 RepID=A0AAD4JMS9_PERFH|nr:hypothetical protein C2S53_002234 [Perilla frutescens var. hirtella]